MPRNHLADPNHRTRNQATPRLVLDEVRLRANIERTAQRVRAAGAVLRPHFKTHKCSRILALQMAAGVGAVTTATLREAELAVAAGIRDVLLAYPPVGDWRLDGIAALLERSRVIVACAELDHVRALGRLGRRVEYYWEVDSGTGRLGTPPGRESADAIEAAGAVVGPRLAGIMAFAGHAYRDAGASALDAAAAREAAALRETSAALAARGVDAGALSTGVTPLRDRLVPGATEYRFGNYVFLDATQVALGGASAEECALTVETTVIGRPAVDRIILDAGSKALAADPLSAATTGFGVVRGHPGLRIERLYEEHAICAAERTCALRLGDVVEVIPNHACTCANLHAAYATRLADGGEELWEIEGRGWTEWTGAAS